jgi:hypothetical protein
LHEKKSGVTTWQNPKAPGSFLAVSSWRFNALYLDLSDFVWVASGCHDPYLTSNSIKHCERNVVVDVQHKGAILKPYIGSSAPGLRRGLPEMCVLQIRLFSWWYTLDLHFHCWLAIWSRSLELRGNKTLSLINSGGPNNPPTLHITGDWWYFEWTCAARHLD